MSNVNYNLKIGVNDNRFEKTHSKRIWLWQYAVYTTEIQHVHKLIAKFRL